MSDKAFFEDARKAVEELRSEEDAKKKSPMIWILVVFIVFVFILSIVPLYSVSINPPPNQKAVKSFELTSAEETKLELIKYQPTSSIEKAISQVNVADYRMITSRLVTSACSSHSDLCYAMAIYYYVRDHDQYVSDPTTQYVQSPAETMLVKSGDCEDNVLTTITMLESIGMDADVGVTKDHAFIRAQLPQASFWKKKSSEYVWLDPTCKTCEFGEVNILKKDVLRWYEMGSM